MVDPMADDSAELPDDVQHLLVRVCDLYELFLQRPISDDPQVMDLCLEMFEALKRVWPLHTAEAIERALMRERQETERRRQEGRD